jgi:hypothetical protein
VTPRREAAPFPPELSRGPTVTTVGPCCFSGSSPRWRTVHTYAQGGAHRSTCRPQLHRRRQEHAARRSPAQLNSVLHSLWITLWRGRPQPADMTSPAQGPGTGRVLHTFCGQLWKNPANVVKTPSDPTAALWTSSGFPQGDENPAALSTGPSTSRHAARRAAPPSIHIFHSTDDDDETPDEGTSPDNEGGKRPTRPLCPRTPDPVVLEADGRLVSEPQWSFVEK